MVNPTIQEEMLKVSTFLPEHPSLLEHRRSSRIKGDAQESSGARSSTYWTEDIIRLERALRRRDVVQCFLEASLSNATGEVNQIKLPKTHKQAMETDADAWGEAERSKFTALEEMETFELAQLPEVKRALPTKFTYTLKTDADGNIMRYKARVVVRSDLAEKELITMRRFHP